MAKNPTPTPEQEDPSRTQLRELLSQDPDAQMQEALVQEAAALVGQTPQVINARDDLHYFVLDTSVYTSEVETNAFRSALALKGFRPVSGPLYEGPPRAEAPRNPRAELWAMPIDRWSAYRKERRKAVQANPLHRDIMLSRSIETDPYADED